MNTIELVTQGLGYDGSVDRSDVGAMLHLFLSSSLEAAEKIYRAFMEEDIHEAYEAYLEDCDEDLDGYQLYGCTICVVDMKTRIGATICLTLENENELRDLEESEICLSKEILDALLAMVE